MRWLLLLAFSVVPMISYASVQISEVAWMGTAASANDEWIELYNTGDASVSVDGWSLSDGNNLNIPLAGTIAPHAYAVLERTDDTTAPGTAFLIYTGALSNSGSTLTLYRTDSSIEDRVVGGENWVNIGGDNATKDTAQRTDTGWVSAPPTPGYGLLNYTPPVVQDTQDQGTADTATSSVKKAADDGRIIEMKIPNVSLQLEMKSLDTITLDQPISFTVNPSGLAPAIMDSISYEWNFGDLGTSSGKKVTHVYTSPGDYVVTVYGTYTRYQQIARTTITVLPVEFALVRKSNGDLLVQNNSPYEVDVSGYVLHGLSDIIFPPRTVMLPHATITIPKEKLQSFSFTPLTLFDPKGVMVAKTNTGFAAQTAQMADRSVAMPLGTDAVKEEIMPSINQIQSTSSNFSFTHAVEVSSTEASGTTREVKPLTMPASTSLENAAVIDAGKNIPTQALPYMALFGVVALGLLAIFAGRIH